MGERASLELYDRVLAAIGERAEAIAPHGCASHWPHVGTRYRADGLLIAGQALQGWDPAVAGARWNAREARTAVGRQRIIEMTRTWFSQAPEPVGVIADLSNRASSPFWTLCRDLVDALMPGDGVWYSRFAWANVYPVSFDQPGDSPWGALKEAQDPLAGRLFAELVDMLNPSRVVVICGPAFWWQTTAAAGSYRLSREAFPLIASGREGGRTWIVGYHPTYARRRKLTAEQYTSAIAQAIAAAERDA